MDQNEATKVFAGFMESQAAVLTELSSRITALQDYLAAQDSEFWNRFEPLLASARTQINNPFDWWKQSGRERPQ
jgi:hypothetical protein